MKRRIKQKEINIQADKNKFWAYVHCVNENMAIAISKMPVRIKNEFGQIKVDKVGDRQWGKDNYVCREGYDLSFENVEIGHMVLCPKCGSKIDFRLMPSINMPDFK